MSGANYQFHVCIVLTAKELYLSLLCSSVCDGFIGLCGLCLPFHSFASVCVAISFF